MESGIIQGGEHGLISFGGEVSAFFDVLDEVVLGDDLAHLALV